MRKLLSAVLLLPLFATPALADVDYRCSGVSEDREAEEANFPHTLKLVYAEPGGGYLGYVDTVIAGADGASVIEVTCDGPWLLADLPPGRYEVRASFEGESKTIAITVPSGGKAGERVITF